MFRVKKMISLGKSVYSAVRVTMSTFPIEPGDRPNSN